jgi:sulfur relay (sulfurtransferase) DsrF/TusC family protein
MLANRASEEAFSAIETAVQAYQQHWFGLLKDGVSTQALDGATPAQLATRNLRNKRIIFDPEVDPVWSRITSMIGEPAVAIQRGLLIGEDE